MRDELKLTREARKRRLQQFELISSWFTALVAIVLLAGLIHEPLFATMQQQTVPDAHKPFSFYFTLGVMLCGMAAAYSQARNNDSTIFNKIALLALVFTMMPYVFQSTDQISPYLFNRDNCEPTLHDYALYVADNIAKGFIVDILESYRINLWELRGCEPNRSFFVGTLSLLIRSLVSFGVIYLAVKIWKRYGFMKAQDAP